MITKIIRIVVLIAKIILLIYGFVYGATYAYTQRSCLSYRYEITELTWDLRPYCVGLYQGQEIVVPLHDLQVSPAAPSMGPIL